MKNKMNYFIFAMGLILLGSVYLQGKGINVNWSFLAVILLVLSILMFFLRFESQKTDSKEIALIATMASLAAISRIPFAVIMSFQPTTFIVMITGYAFGVQTGFLVGASAAFVSNVFLGQGPWTPWQMFCWGLCGALAGLLSKRHETFNQKAFVILCVACGYIYGNIMTFWHWVTFVYPLTFTTFIETYILSFPFDTLHATGNLIFSMTFGKTFYRILTRFKKRFTFEKIE